MKYLLIDTNCWIDLLHEGYQRNLDILEYWVGHRKVTLLIPEQLLTEWENQKQIQPRLLNKARNDYSNKLRSLKSLIKVESDYVERTILRIDNLFKSGKHFKSTKTIQADVTKRFIDKKAPFHRANNNSNSDALIVLSAIDFLKRKKEEVLTFITGDGDDFGDPKNPEKLHEDLRSPDVKIDYFLNIGNAINILKGELGDLQQLGVNRSGDYTAIFEVLPPSQSYSTIDQILYALKSYQDQITFVPTKILVRIYPFKISNIKFPYSYYSPFRINSNNKELVEFFIQVENTWKNKKTKFPEAYGLNKRSNREKVSEILRILHHNLIFHIGYVNNQLESNLDLVEEEFCNCVLCSYNRFDFFSSFSALSRVPLQNDAETMKHAYVHFQFGNFARSISLFYYVYNKSEQEKKYLRSFICLYNLKRLSRYIRDYTFQIDLETNEILSNVDRLSFQQHQLIAGSDAFLLENIKWIANNDFYNNAFQEVTNILSKIKNHYYTQLSGGWSTNSNYHILLSEFAEIDSFLDQNNIIYNNYSEFAELGSKFVEGVLTTYSFDERQSQRLSSIDDLIIIIMAKCSDRETIIKHYNRLHLSGLKYHQSSRVEPALEQVTLTLLSDYQKFRNLFGETGDLTNSFFWDKYKRIFANLILFITIADSKTLNYAAIFDLLLKILPDEKFLRKFDEKIIADFVREKGLYFSTEQIKKFLILCINNEKLHAGDIFRAINFQVSKYHPSIVIDRKIYPHIIRNFLDECPKCKSFHHSEILTQVYGLLSPVLKKNLQKKLIAQLKTNFKPDVYYTLAIHDIIDYKAFFDQYLQASEPPSEPNKRRPIYDQTVANYYRLSEILNLAFKFKLDLREERFQRFKGISDYYDWLLDMDNFDYSKFDAKWILAYRTDFYLNQIFEIDRVKAELKSYLRKYKHPILSELYIAFL